MREAKIGVRAKVTQYTRIDVRISIQLHFDYQEKKALRHRSDRSTLPISLYTLPHRTTTSRPRGWGRRLCFWCRASLGYRSLCPSTSFRGRSWGYSLGLRSARLADRFRCWFRFYTATDASGLRATTDGHIEVDPRPSRWSVVAQIKANGRAHAYPGKRVIREGLPLCTCVSASSGSPILLVERLTACRCSCRSQKLGGREENGDWGRSLSLL